MMEHGPGHLEWLLNVASHPKVTTKPQTKIFSQHKTSTKIPILKLNFPAIHEEIKELEKLEDKMEELAEEMAEDRQIAFNMASKMAEDREMTERMAKEISDNCAWALHFDLFSNRQMVFFKTNIYWLSCSDKLLNLSVFNRLITLLINNITW